MIRDRGPLAPRGKPRASSTAQPALFENVDQPPAPGRMRAEAPLVLVDAFVTRGLVWSRDQSPADCGAQFSGPDVTS